MVFCSRTGQELLLLKGRENVTERTVNSTIISQSDKSASFQLIKAFLLEDASVPEPIKRKL